ncbi:hypothetical protein O5626_30770, partial [Escherichia coli]|nr:hypothetical protein [Escherichia coli]
AKSDDVADCLSYADIAETVVMYCSAGPARTTSGPVTCGDIKLTLLQTWSEDDFRRVGLARRCTLIPGIRIMHRSSV